jgi:hypothetical protein
VHREPLEVQTVRRERALPLHVWPWRECGSAGLRRQRLSACPTAT